MAKTWQLTKAQAIQQILQAEQQAVTFRKLGRWLKGSEYQQLTRILIPDHPQDLPTTTWTSIVDTNDLHAILTKEGQMHYRQAASSPLVSGPIGEKIGPFDDNTHGDKILNGAFDLSNIDEMQEVKDIIHGMRYPDSGNPTPTFDTTIEHDQFYKAVYRMRERTSSSPSGQHYGHYRALLRDPTLLGCIASLANFCFTWGITLKHWEKAIQPLILKEPGTPRIHRMQCIVLIKGDLNICLSEIFSCCMMNNAEKYGLLHRGQYGACREKMTISMVLLK